MKYTELAKDCPTCMGCRLPNDGTIVLAHRNLNGWGMLFGRGVKAVSLGGAFLCGICHAYGDGDGQRDYHWWEMATQRSLTWAWTLGCLRFEPKPVDIPDGRLR